MLPHVDGLEVCRRPARGRPKTAAIPIIMLTARAEESERIVGLEIGADDYLAKPFSPNELVARVRALLRRAHARRPRRPTAITLRSDRRRSPSGTPCRSTAQRRDADRQGIPAARVPAAASRPRAVARRAARPTSGATATPAARGRSTSTCGGCARSCRCSREALVTVKQFGYKLVTRSAARALMTAAATFQTQALPRRARRGGDRAGRRRRAVRDDDAAADRRADRADARRGGAACGRTARAQLRTAAGRTPLARSRRRSRPHWRAARRARHVHRAPTAACVGDSAETLDGVAAMENHASGPKSSGARAAARPQRAATAPRSKIDMLYVAVPVRHPGDRVRPGGAAADRRPPAAAARSSRRRSTALGLALARRRGDRVDARRPHRPARARDRRRRAALSQRRPRRRRASTTATTSSGRWRARSTTRCRSSDGGSTSRRAIARAWRRSSPAWSKASSSSIRRDGCSSPTTRRGEMLKLDDAGDRPSVRRDDPASGDRRAGRRARSAARRRSRWSSSPPRDAVADDHRARRAGVGRRRARRGAGAARHHRPAARRSDPPRLRRQRVARAAHAADGDPRLRRGAVGGDADARGRRGGSSTSSRATPQRMERLVKDLLRLARLDAGQETLDIVALRRAQRSSQAVVADLAPALERAAQRVDVDDRAGRRDGARPIRRSCTTCCAIWSRTRAPTRPSGPTIRVDARRAADERVAIGVRRGPGHSRRGSVARVRAVLPRRQVARARSRRHRPRPGDREAPGGAARRRGAAPRTARRAARGSRSRCRRDRGEAGSDLTSSYALPSSAQQRVGAGADRERGGNRQHPRPDDLAGDAPAHGRQPPRRADADDRAGDRVRRADRHAEQRRRSAARAPRRSPRRSRRPAAAW